MFCEKHDEVDYWACPLCMDEVNTEIEEMQRYNRRAAEKAAGSRREIERLDRVVSMREKDIEGLEREVRQLQQANSERPKKKE